ncbi:MAG: hypothetical protein LKE33_05470 [Acidaminococcus sp.]|nr:hypothetical protein [Acidaminococcus sp.]MCI2101127.1 hypothetical protein [Acidaminococcus sp.]MCI2115524.1 hypothetical protein [Acidaminococcus sp.]MCI2117656.1 hypothetical protein [Acidaminococcus sp.]
MLLSDYMMIIMAFLAGFRWNDKRSFAVWICCAIYVVIRIVQIKKARKNK